MLAGVGGRLWFLELHRCVQPIGVGHWSPTHGVHLKVTSSMNLVLPHEGSHKSVVDPAGPVYTFSAEDNEHGLDQNLQIKQE